MIFYIVSIFLLIAIGCTLVFNNIYALLSLIVVFCISSCIFVALEAEFLGMMMLIAYGGAVAILFLFVIMMVGTNAEEVSSFSRRTSISLFLTLLLSFSVLYISSLFFFPDIEYKLLTTSEQNTNNSSDRNKSNNIVVIGQNLYSLKIIEIQLIAIIFLVGIIGCVGLSRKNIKFAKKQNFMKQIFRTKAESIEIISFSKNNFSSKDV